jgi:hypothetical protein
LILKIQVRIPLPSYFCLALALQRAVFGAIAGKQLDDGIQGRINV